MEDARRHARLPLTALRELFNAHLESHQFTANVLVRGAAPLLA